VNGELGVKPIIVVTGKLVQCKPQEEDSAMLYGKNIVDRNKISRS
jgi:hypothetical protein